MIETIATPAAASEVTVPTLDALGILRPNRQRARLSTLECCFAQIEHRQTRWALEARHLMWLLEAPAAGAARPRMRRLGTGAQEFAAQPHESKASPLFQKRQRAMRAAIADQRQLLAPLMAALEPDRVAAAEFSAYLAGRADGCSDLWSYFNHLHRDWGWGDDENRRSLEAVLELLPRQSPPQKMLVPGAGACRLAYDLHRAVEPGATIATDVQPLLFLCAAPILNGGTVTLYEFPPFPLDLASCAVRRDLSAPAGPAGDDFHLVLTDVTERCFQPRAFDCVVSHWFIDAVPVDLHRLFPMVNELLSEGGTWINVGPTMFGATFGEPPSRMYSVEEVLEAAPAAGFELERTFQRRQPYLVSPSSASHRVERVLGFRAIKTRDVPLPEPPQAPPAPVPTWLADTSRAVELQTDVHEFIVAHEATAEVLRGAEKRLSIGEIADRVEATLGISREIAKAHAEKTLRALVAASAS